MKMPDVIYAAHKIYPNDYGAEWMQENGLGRDKYHHDRIVEALKAEHDRRVTELLESNNKLVEKNRELQSKLDKAKWQPIESAPKDDFIIVTDGGFYAQAFWNNDKWMMGFIDGAINVKVDLYPTHWMPLPDAPEQR